MGQIVSHGRGATILKQLVNEVNLQYLDINDLKEDSVNVPDNFSPPDNVFQILDDRLKYDH